MHAVSRQLHINSAERDVVLRLRPSPPLEEDPTSPAVGGRDEPDEAEWVVLATSALRLRGTDDISREVRRPLLWCLAVYVGRWTMF
mmetsp:Transcript_20373/g.36350  ORF Transcript_20373/g.36350 Transcript_20373/m.36350 type:complete len:86 (+) Transcript_20373:312-569(+)